MADDVLVDLFFWELVTFWGLIVMDVAEEAMEVLFTADAIAEDIDCLMEEVILVTFEAAVIEDASEEELSVTPSSECDVAAGLGGGEATLTADGGAVAVT